MDAEAVARSRAHLRRCAPHRHTPIARTAASDAGRPNTADVNAIIDAVTDTLTEQDGETIGGWKIGLVYSPRQVPMICPLFDSRLFASPARVPLDAHAFVAHRAGNLVPADAGICRAREALSCR